MRIGNVEIKNNIALAPMAGVTDLPFRPDEDGAGGASACIAAFRFRP